jgi:hypothetical protein
MGKHADEGVVGRRVWARRVGGEQRRKHDDVAKDEDPEPIGDDNARRGRPAASLFEAASIVAVVIRRLIVAAFPITVAEVNRNETEVSTGMVS